MDLTVSRALAGYAATQKTIPPLGPVADKTSAPQAIGSGDGKNFGAVVGEMAGAAIQNLRAGESKSLAGVAGQADVQSVVEALANAEMTMRTVVAMRDKVVEAYQDILRMPI
tara:strand:+ start:2247 stop:2582 length:336 start_codon:yes stop_codon:yes gene_type:complete